jgi:hypothetical protein
MKIPGIPVEFMDNKKHQNLSKKIYYKNYHYIYFGYKLFFEDNILILL